MDIFLICICLCHIVLSVSCSFGGVTCWKRADLLALLYVTICFVSVTFPYDVLGQYLIVLIPDLCLLPGFTWSEIQLTSFFRDEVPPQLLVSYKKSNLTLYLVAAELPLLLK